MNEESRDNFQELMKLRHNGWKPYHMAQIDGREVELISYPFWRGNKVMILARTEKGDATSMRQFNITENL